MPHFLAYSSDVIQQRTLKVGMHIEPDLYTIIHTIFGCAHEIRMDFWQTLGTLFCYLEAFFHIFCRRDPHYFEFWEFLSFMKKKYLKKIGDVDLAQNLSELKKITLLPF